MPRHARRVRALLFPALIVVACAEGQGFDRDRDTESGGRAGTSGSGGKSSATGGTKATGGTSSGGQATGGKAATGGTTATGGKAATGGSKATGGSVATGGTAGSTLTGGPTCRFTDPPEGDGGMGGAPDTGVGASSGADAGGSSSVGGSGGVSDTGGVGGATSVGDGPADSAGAGGFAGAGGASGGGPAHAFCDDFEDGDAGGWVPQSCDWNVVADDSFSLEGGPGTCQIGAGSSVWVDQIIEARVKVTSFGGTSNSYRTGLVARSDGATNYYALGLSGNGALRLLHGTSTLSGSGSCGDYSAGVVVGTWYTLRLEVTGPANSVSLSSFIDGKPAQRCTVTTSTAASGSAGVFTYGNTTALFDDVRIWTP